MHEDWLQNSALQPRISRNLGARFGALLLLGLSIFVPGLMIDSMRAWQIYLVNFLFWSGLAQGAVVFAAIYHVVGAGWGPVPRRLAEGMACYVAVSLIAFVPLYVGLGIFFGASHDVHGFRGAWFDPRFMFVRGLLGLGLLSMLSLLFLYYSVRPEVGLLVEQGRKPRRWPYTWLAGSWGGFPAEAQRSARGMDLLSVGVLVAYPVIYTFMAFDLIMALDPHWHSALFGVYFFMSSFYLGLAGLAAVSVLVRDREGRRFINGDHAADLGKLLFGFCLVYVSMIWSQYIVIWYGNLPEETGFVILRLWERPWAVLSWSVFGISVVIPFVIFLSRRAKEAARIMLAVSILIAAGLWLERYVLVVPSLWRGETVPLGWIEIGITAGFLGAFGLCYLFFLKTFPVVPLAGLTERERSA